MESSDNQLIISLLATAVTAAVSGVAVLLLSVLLLSVVVGGGPRVVVSTAAFHARVRGSVPGFGGLKETKMFLPHPRVKVSIVGSLRDQEVACSASDRQGSNFESCVWRTVSSQSSHHPQEVLLAQFSLYVHKGGLKPDSFHLLLSVTGSDGLLGKHRNAVVSTVGVVVSDGHVHAADVRWLVQHSGRRKPLTFVTHQTWPFHDHAELTPSWNLARFRSW